MPKSKKKKSEKEVEKSTITFYCEKCDISFEIEDGTPLDDVKCPKCKTYEIFIEYEEEDGKIKF